MSVASLDASVIVCVLVGDKPAACKKIVKLLGQDELHFAISDIALSETVYVLDTIYHKSREEISDLLLFFLARYSDNIEYSHDLTMAVFPFYLSHPKLSFNDCVLAAMAEINNAEPLFTLDRKLASQHPSAKLV